MQCNSKGNIENSWLRLYSVEHALMTAQNVQVDEKKIFLINLCFAQRNEPLPETESIKIKIYTKNRNQVLKDKETCRSN